MKRKTVLVHVLCWVLYLGYSLADTAMRKTDKSFIDKYFWDFSYVLVQVIQFYFCYLWVFPNFLKKEKVWQLIGGIVLALLLFQVTRYLLEQVLSLHLIGLTNWRGNYSLWGMILTNLYFGTWMIGISGAIFAINRSLQQEQRNRELQQEATKAELAFLRSQINPHFLYNALNYMYSLAIPVSDELAKAIVKLSDIMRYTFSETKDGRVELVKEVEYANAYVELLRMRFAPNFYVKWEVGDLPENVKIAPLLLIPFVENALKHGVINDPQRPVRIKLIYVNGKLTLTVNNKIGQQQKDRSSGVGLANVRRRLELIYPDKYELLISNNGRSYGVTLIIELE